MDEDDRRDRSGGPTFEPPVYRQRYEVVENVVREYGAKKVIDFGCSEGKLISKLKRVECIEELVGIDIDLETLEFNEIKAKPFAADYLDPRLNPLTVSFYQGSIAECDERFVGFDVIACVEIIEHFHAPVLAAMPDVVFGHLLPKVAVVTTPNSEFNVLFPGMKGFRHYDHKFEWTRAEFQKWSVDVATKYGYTVSFTGVGDGPPGTEHLGKCSQIAIFLKNDEQCENRGIIPEGQQAYIKVISCIHPCKEERSIEECLADELEYYTLFLAGEYMTESDSNQAEIPLERFLDFPRVWKLSRDIELLRSVINNCPKLELNEQQTAVLYTRAHSDWPSDNEDDGNEKRSQWESEGVGTYYNEYYKLNHVPSESQEECWDIEMGEGEKGTPWDHSGSSQPHDAGCVDLTSSNPTTSGGRLSDGCQGTENSSGQEKWMYWRGRSTRDDCDCDDNEDIFADRDYTW